MKKIVAIVLLLLVTTTAFADCSFRVIGKNFKWTPKSLSIGTKTWKIPDKAIRKVSWGKAVIWASKTELSIELGKELVSVRLVDSKTPKMPGKGDLRPENCTT